jgi:hypothetical protein
MHTFSVVDTPGGGGGRWGAVQIDLIVFWGFDQSRGSSIVAPLFSCLVTFLFGSTKLSPLPTPSPMRASMLRRNRVLSSV